MPTEELFGAYNFLLEVSGAAAGRFRGFTVTQPARGRPEGVLTGGRVEDDTLWNWHRTLGSRRSVPAVVTVRERDRRERTVRAWRFENAIPVRYQGPAGRAGRTQSLNRFMFGIEKTILGRAVGGDRRLKYAEAQNLPDRPFDPEMAVQFVRPF